MAVLCAKTVVFFVLKYSQSLLTKIVIVVKIIMAVFRIVKKVNNKNSTNDEYGH